MRQHIVVFIDATWNSDDGGDSCRRFLWTGLRLTPSALPNP